MGGVWLCRSRRSVGVTTLRDRASHSPDLCNQMEKGWEIEVNVESGQKPLGSVCMSQRLQDEFNMENVASPWSLKTWCWGQNYLSDSGKSVLFFFFLAVDVACKDGEFFLFDLWPRLAQLVFERSSTFGWLPALALNDFANQLPNSSHSSSCCLGQGGIWRPLLTQNLHLQAPWVSPCGNLNENGPDGPKGVALLGPVALLE